MLRSGDTAFEELAATSDAEQLCRRLLASPAGWGSSTRHAEAVELLAGVHGTGELPVWFVALMLCTCRRWDRVTGRLIAAVQDSGLLDSAALDELAEAFLSHEHEVIYPLTWVSPQWLEIDIDDRHGRVRTVDENTLAHHRVSVEPPLRRWAAARVLRSAPERLGALLRAAERLDPRDRSAIIHGLLDSGGTLGEPARRALIDRGLKASGASVRRAALDRLCELDGPETARRRALSDPNATVRNWRAPEPAFTPALFQAVMISSRPAISKAQLDTMIEEATVDSYNESEQVTGLFTMLQDHLALPFETTLLGVSVTVARVELTANEEIVAICRRDDHKQLIPVLDLPLPTPSPDGAEWVEAYRRWLR
jgi:hypothetical protein